MAYAQRNYPKTIQGIRGIYTIAQIGCFVTSFCNLLKDFDHVISPDKLNTKLVQKGVYIDVDDGVRDDLAFTSITKVYPDIVVTKTGTSAVPPTAKSIVRIKANNGFGTHFCKVSKIVGKTVYVEDSWDGKVKKASEYGPITAWATYTDKTPPKKPVATKPVKVKPVKKAQKPKKVTVKKGQYLSLIARLYGLTLGKLLDKNPKYKKNPNLVKAGAKINI